MAPSQRSMLALLGLIVSTQAAPAALPQASIGKPSFWVSWDTGSGIATPGPTTQSEVPTDVPGPKPTPSDVITLNPPSYSISWDTGAPSEPTKQPEYPELPNPKPSNQISLGVPSFSISWDTGAPSEPTKQPEYPELPNPKPSNEISLGQPSVSFSFDGSPVPLPVPTSKYVPSQPAPSTPVSSKAASSKISSTKKSTSKKTKTTTKKPWWPWYPAPTPTPVISGLPTKYSVSWETASPQPTGGVEDPEEDPEESSLPPVKPSDQISLGPISASITWNRKRQWQEDTETVPTPTPQKTSEPGLSFPPIPWPTLPNHISLGSARYSVTWNKQQEEVPEPTDAPSPPFPPSPPKNDITLAPPKATVIWGKKEKRVPETNSYGFEFTKLIPSFSLDKPKVTASIVWGKRDGEIDDLEKRQIIVFPTPTNEISAGKPSATIIWGRDAEAENVEKRQIIVFPTATDEISAGKPSATISWGRRQWEEDTVAPTPTPAPEEPELPIPHFPFPTPKNSIGLQPPRVSVSWGKRQEEVPEPTDAPFPDDDPFPPVLPSPPKNDITLAPPKATVIWGKEKRQIDTPPDFTIGLPKPSFSWVKPPKSTPYVSWGRRDAEAEPQVNTIGLGIPVKPTISWYNPAPTNTPYISWGLKREAEAAPTKREAAPAPQQLPPHWPSNIPFPSWYTKPWGPEPSTPYISWGKREEKPKPTPIPTLQKSYVPRKPRQA